MAKNEKTSKAVATDAAKLMREIKLAQVALGLVSAVLIKASSIAASALTQAPDRKKKHKVK